MADQVSRYGIHAAQFSKLVQEHANHGLYLFIGIHGQLAALLTGVADRCVVEQLAAFGLVQSALVHALPQDVQFRLSEGPLRPSKSRSL